MEIDARFLLPEIILLATACAATLLGLSRVEGLRRATQWLAALACAAAFAAAATGNFGMAAEGFIGGKFPAALNPNFITLLATSIGLLSVLAAWGMPSTEDPSKPDAAHRGEFFGMMLFSLAGVSMVGKVNDLVWLFVVLELVSIPTYIMVATGRGQIIAQEAGVKYFFLGALAAAIFLFGFSYLYGATGHTRFDAIHAWFADTEKHPATALATIGFLMVIVGIAYKMAAWPLHFYAPDVYQGAATPVTAFLAFAPKTAGVVAIISILNLIDFDYLTPSGRAIGAVVMVMAVVTMSVGNVMALLQRNIKRLLAYSSIAHSGYMLVGLVAMNAPATPGDGVSATVFYLASYAIMNLGAFAVLIHLQGKADAAEDLDDIAGLAKAHPGAAFMMALCLFSLIGMPLTVGFLGKYYIVTRALSTGHTVVAVIVVINAAIAAAYYLRIIGAMYLREALYPFTVRNIVPVRVTAVICSVAVVAFFVLPGALLIPNNVSTEGEKEKAAASLMPSAPAAVAAAK